MLRQVDPKSAHELQDSGYTYLDVRTEAEFAEGHAEGAVNIPAFLKGPGGMQPNPEFLEVAGKVFSKDDKIMLGCRSGGRSQKAGELLADHGFTDLYNIAGGFVGSADQRGWSKLGLPSSSETDGVDYAAMKEKAAR